MARRYFYRFHIIGLASAGIDGVILHAIGQRFANDRQIACHNAVIALRQRAREIIIIAWIIGIDRQNQIGLGILLNGLAVQENLTFAQGNRVTGQANDTFDPILIFALRRQNHNIATGRHFPPDPLLAFRKRDGQRLYFLA